MPNVLLSTGITDLLRPPKKAAALEEKLVPLSPHQKETPANPFKMEEEEERELAELMDSD